MQHRAMVLCLLAVTVSFLPLFLQAGKKPKKSSIDQLIENKKVACYRVSQGLPPKTPELDIYAPLIDLIEDIVTLQPKPNDGFMKNVSARHHYRITCESEIQLADAQFVKIYARKGIFIIPALDTIIGTVDGVRYKVESVKRIKATLKNVEQIEFILSIIK